MVFDATISYPWSVAGYKLISTLGIYNVTDKEYSEGSFVLAPARNWLFSTSIQF